ncbi:MAG: hypothetical protein IPG89_20675 [Bacteroidetes bacterium]|nr:hypothetical protein [Bacteroidota bacterium]
MGEITGLTESQVKVYIFRARQTLKNYLVKLEVVIYKRMEINKNNYEAFLLDLMEGKLSHEQR